MPNAQSRIEELRQEADLVDQMIARQKVVNNGLSEHIKARKEILELQQALKKSQQDILKVEKEILTMKEKGSESTEDEIKDAEKLRDHLKKRQIILKQKLDVQKQSLSVQKTITKEIEKGVNKLFDQVFSLRKIVNLYLEIDKAIRTTSVGMGLTGDMANIFRNNLEGAMDYASTLGVSAAELAKVQKEVASLTGRQLLLSQAQFESTSELLKIFPQIGAAMAQMENFGFSIGEGAKFYEKVMQDAIEHGLDAQKMMGFVHTMTGDISKLRFKNFEQGLKNVSRKLIRLKSDFAGIATFADKVFRPEGAIEAAAALQVLGGEMSALGDPFKLMFQARNDTEGFVDSVLKATKFVGKFDSASGIFRLTANEIDRLNELSKITGESVQKLSERALEQAKMGTIDSQMSMFATPEDKEFLRNIAQVQKGGGATVQLLDGEGKTYTKELSQVSSQMIEQHMVQQQAAADQAAQLLTFKESLDALLVNLQLLFMPAVEMFSSAVKSVSDWFMGLSTFSKWGTVIGLGIAKLLFSAVSWLAAGASFGIGFRTTSGTGLMSTAMGGASGSQMAGAGAARKASLLGTAAVIAAIGAAVMMIGAGVMLATKGFAQLGDVVKDLPNEHLGAFSGMISTIMWSMTAMVGILGATAVALMYFGAMASAPPMWMAVGVLLAIGAAAALLGGGIWLASDGMARMVAELAKMNSIQGVGTELLLMSVAVAALGVSLAALGYLLLNPFGAVGVGAGLSLIGSLAFMGPALHEAGKGVLLLKENIGGLGRELNNLGNADTGMFSKLVELDKLITRTQSKPIIVEVGGDVGGKILVDFKDISRDISVSDLSDDFVTEITRKISDELQKGNYGRSKEK